MRLLISVVLAGVAVASHAATVDLVRPPDTVRITTQDATLDPTVRKTVDGEDLVAVTFKPAPKPSLVLAPKQGAWAWPADGTMRLRVQNGMPWPVTLIVDVASGAKHLTATVGVPPGPPQTLSVPLQATSPRAFGMQVGPPMPFSSSAEAGRSAAKRLVGGGSSARAGGSVAADGQVAADGSVGADPVGDSQSAATSIADRVRSHQAGSLFLVATSVEGSIDAGAISSVTLSMPQPGAAQTLLFGELDDVNGNADLISAYTAIVDRYGQYTRATWPEKIASDAELKARANAAPTVAELKARANAAPTVAELKAPANAVQPASEPKGLDKYGGRTDLPAMQATGWFHTQKQGDRWWLVTPEGHAFFSLGVNAVNLTDGRTYVQGREFMFTDPSAANGPYSGTADSRSDQGSQRDNGMNYGRWWDVYTNNVARTLGDKPEAAWRKRTVDRLKAWRFNTLGNWSDPAFAGDQRIAYTVPILIRGDFNTVSTGYDYWGRMPDPFDPRFAKATAAAVANATKNVRDDPWLLGYFADNELAWAGAGPQGRWALATGSLAQGPDSPAKQAFLAYLKKTHGDAATFAKAWGVAVTTWEQVAASGFKAPDPSEAHPAIAADYIAFLKLYANQYFRTVAQTLKKADPHHLFLGGRLAVRTPEVEEASAAYADVTSINTYTDLPQHGFDVAAFRKLDKPVMITEFHFGSSDRGPFGNGVAAVASEEERGKAYTRFVDAAVASGIIVGTHWFQYVDQPVTGRVLDGENSHIGLVGITDIPFDNFTRAVTDTNARTGGGSVGGR